MDEYVTKLKKPATRDGPQESSFTRKAWLSKELPHSYFPLSGPAGQVVVVLSCVVMSSFFSYFLLLLKLHLP